MVYLRNCRYDQHGRSRPHVCRRWTALQRRQSPCQSCCKLNCRTAAVPVSIHLSSSPSSSHGYACAYSLLSMLNHPPPIYVCTGASTASVVLGIFAGLVVAGAAVAGAMYYYRSRGTAPRQWNALQQADEESEAMAPNPMGGGRDMSGHGGDGGFVSRNNWPKPQGSGAQYQMVRPSRPAAVALARPSSATRGAGAAFTLEDDGDGSPLKALAAKAPSRPAVPMSYQPPEMRAEASDVELIPVAPGAHAEGHVMQAHPASQGLPVVQAVGASSGGDFFDMDDDHPTNPLMR